MSFELSIPLQNVKLRQQRTYIMNSTGVDILSYKLNSAEGPFTDIIASKLNSDVAQYVYSIRRYPIELLEHIKTQNDNGLDIFPGVEDGTNVTSESGGYVNNPLVPDSNKFMKRISIGDRTNNPTFDDSGRVVPEGSVTFPDGSTVSVYLMGAVMNNRYNAAIDLGTIQIPEKYGNFLDRAPYTSVEIYLPYHGFIQLDANEVVGKSVRVQYVIDFSTGSATSFTTLHEGSEDTVLLDMRTFPISDEVSISSNNEAELSRNRLLAGMSMGSQISSSLLGGQPFKIGETFTQATADFLSTSVPKFNRGTEGSQNAGAYAPQYLIAVISRPIPLYAPGSTEYNKYLGEFGAPSQKPVRLHEIPAGTFFSCSAVRLDNCIGTATKEEVQELESLLRSGVFR